MYSTLGLQVLEECQVSQFKQESYIYCKHSNGLYLQVVMFSFLLVNCLMYVALLHVLYAILLRSMGYKTMRMPAFLEKRLLPSQYHASR